MTDDYLAWAAAYAMKHPFLMAQALAQFQYQFRISNEELAKYLQCSLDNLPKLALCRKPLDGSGSDIQKIADYAGCDRERLKQLLVQVERSK